MVVYKCDRCGKIYEKPESVSMKFLIYVNPSRNNQHTVDLCYDCVDDLRKFIEEYKNGKVF